MTRAIYAGSFDPPTLGHLHVISVARQLFDHVVIAVGVNPAKPNALFTPEERIMMLTQMVIPRPDELSRSGLPFSFHAYEGTFLVHEAIDRHCSYIVRGIRNARDFEDEMAMAELNKQIALTHVNVQKNGNPQTIFIPTPSNLALISSSMVKSLIGFGDWREQIKNYVPAATYEAILEKYDSGR